jgi:hypothetical protein
LQIACEAQGQKYEDGAEERENRIIGEVPQISSLRDRPERVDGGLEIMASLGLSVTHSKTI